MYVRIILRWIVKQSGTSIHGLDFPGSGRQPVFGPVYYNATVHPDSSLMLILFCDFCIAMWQWALLALFWRQAVSIFCVSGIK